MIKRKPFHPEPSDWEHFPEFTKDGVTVWPGDLVGMAGKRNKRYKFRYVLTNAKTEELSVVVLGPVTMHGDGIEHVKQPEQIKVFKPRKRRRKS